MRAWLELEDVTARMRRLVVAESDNALEVTDGVEYLLSALRAAIDNSLNALEPSETLYHYTELHERSYGAKRRRVARRRRPPSGCPILGSAVL